MPVPYKLNYFEIETGIDSTSTFIHTGDLTATKVKKYLATSNDILLGDGTTTSLSGLQPTGNYITALTGEATATGPGSVAITLSNSAVIGKVLTSLSITGSTIAATDTILQAFGKLQNQINGKQATITLTTTGTSGAATFISNVLNIPQYTDAFVGTVTSVSALTLGTTGTDLSSTVANSTTTPVITLNVPTASAANRGALSSADWTTFNSKQAAGNYITSLTGEATASGPGASSVTLDNTAVIGKVLTGLNVTGGTVISTDSILSAFGKVQNQINGLVGGSIFQGTWNANTNTPALTSSVGTNGHYYIVSVDGSTNLNGITDWKVGDWAIFAGTAWQKVDNTDSVASVNGYTGTVSLVTGDVLEGAGSLPSRPSQLYFTDARARAAISLTTSGSSGASTYNSTTGVFNIPDYGSALSGYIPYTGATTAIDLNAKTVVNIAHLGINTTSVPTILIRAVGDNNSSSRIAMRGYSSDANSSSIRVTKFRGTVGAPQAPQNGDSLGKFELAGYGTTSSDGYPQASFEGLATENWGATARGSKIVVKVTPNTTTTQAVALTINQDKSSVFESSVTATSLIKTGGTSSQFLKADGTVDSTAYGTGSVTSVAALTLGTSGTDLSSSVANGTTTPVITLNVPNASATNRGALSSADWSTFNGKQNSITLTTTGSSGASTLIGSTLNIPNYVTDLSGYLPLTGGTLTGALAGTSGTFTSANTTNYWNGSSGLVVKNDGTANTGVVLFSRVTNEQYIASLDDDVTSFLFFGVRKSSAVNGIDAMVIRGSGNVGIGTQEPTQQLQVGDNSGVMALGDGLTSNGTSRLKFTSSNSVTNWQISNNDSISGAFEIMPSTAAGGKTFTTPVFSLSSTGAASFSSTITTGSPSGGTAKPFKIGNVATVTPTLQNRTIEIEIDGTTYYLTAKTTNN